ncbi:MAG: ribosomal RNA small subunit methyltransferase A [Patescibacteria group bacterium]|nr:ribosomal RNA small subunit methyltransferase A [Patescibacteria group bacterium]
MIHRAKKSLGQNFLKSIPALNMMCEAGNVSIADTILEIGPGKGALTEKLLEKAGHVIAIEKDHELLAFLKEKFQEEIGDKKLELIYGDILDFDPSSIGLKESEYKIISNIPYNITGSIFKKFLSETIQPSLMILLVQKEVAERIVARDSKESILSLSVKAYGNPKYMMKVGKRFFSPSPKVDSAIIAITDISKKNFNNNKNLEVKFFEIIKASFAHKRKVLRKNLESLTSAEKIHGLFSLLNINPQARAEDLHFSVWLKIANFLNE